MLRSSIESTWPPKGAEPLEQHLQIQARVRVDVIKASHRRMVEVAADHQAQAPATVVVLDSANPSMVRPNLRSWFQRPNNRISPRYRPMERQVRLIDAIGASAVAQVENAPVVPAVGQGGGGFVELAVARVPSQGAGEPPTAGELPRRFHQ